MKNEETVTVIDRRAYHSNVTRPPHACITTADRSAALTGIPTSVPQKKEFGLRHTLLKRKTKLSRLFSCPVSA